MGSGMETADVGVLFVHGIGEQQENETLAAFYRPLVRTACLLHKAGVDSSSEETGATPFHIESLEAPIAGRPAVSVKVNRAEVAASWLLTEAWWARSFSPPKTAELIRWLLLVVPWLLHRHALRPGNSRLPPLAR
jgi:hypothetical protein